MTEIAFWGSLALVLYAYFGYPCALLALSLVRHHTRPCDPPNLPRTAQS